jgi:hypothetical protein
VENGSGGGCLARTLMKRDGAVRVAVSAERECVHPVVEYHVRRGDSAGTPGPHGEVS